MVPVKKKNSNEIHIIQYWLKNISLNPVFVVILSFCTKPSVCHVNWDPEKYINRFCKIWA